MTVAIAMALAAIALSQAPRRAESFDPFGTFIAKVKAAQPSAFVGRPGFAVESAAAFAEMKAHVLELYRGVTARNSFIGSDRLIVDCVPIDQQPSLRPPGRPRADVSRDTPGSAVNSQPGQRDRLGNEMSCQPGTVPIVRVTLERIAKFRTLAAFLAK